MGKNFILWLTLIHTEFSRKENETKALFLSFKFNSNKHERTQGPLLLCAIIEKPTRKQTSCYENMIAKTTAQGLIRMNIFNGTTITKTNVKFKITENNVICIYLSNTK